MRKSTLSICISLSLICLLALPVTFNQAGSKVRGIAAEPQNNPISKSDNQKTLSIVDQYAEQYAQIQKINSEANQASQDAKAATPTQPASSTPDQNGNQSNNNATAANAQTKPADTNADVKPSDQTVKANAEVAKKDSDADKKAKEKEELEKKNKERLANAEKAVEKAEQAYDEAKEYYDDVMADPYASNRELRKAERDLEKAKKNLRKADRDLAEVERDVKKSEGRYYSRRHDRNFDNDLSNNNMAYLLSYWMLMQNNANYALSGQGMYNQMPMMMGYGLDLNAQAQWAHLNNSLGPVAHTINNNYYGAQHNYYGLDLNRIPAIGGNVNQTYNLSVYDGSIRDYSKVIMPDNSINGANGFNAFEREPASALNATPIQSSAIAK